MWGVQGKDDKEHRWSNISSPYPQEHSYGTYQAANPDAQTFHQSTSAPPSGSSKNWTDQASSQSNWYPDAWGKPPATAISIKTRLYSMKSTGNQSAYSDGDVSTTTSRALMWSLHQRDNVTIVRDATPSYQPPYPPRSPASAAVKPSLRSKFFEDHSQKISQLFDSPQRNSQLLTNHPRASQIFTNPLSAPHLHDKNLDGTHISGQDCSKTPFASARSQQQLVCSTESGRRAECNYYGLEGSHSLDHPCDPEAQPLLGKNEPLFLATNSSSSYRPSSPLEMFKWMSFMAPGHMNPKLMSKFAQAYEEYCDTEGGQPGPACNKQPPYKRSASIFGMLVFLLWILASGWYFYVRVVYTLDSSYKWYALLILSLELFTALSTFNYAFLLTRTTRTTGSPGLPPVSKKVTQQLPGVSSMPTQFNVRVLIPCYREACELVMKTVRAATTAMLPQSTSLTVYLCDDGRDPSKAKAVQSMPNVVYVSGRERMKGEVNGKSNNLNYALNLIYQVEEPIPESEIVVVFDADMVPNPDFFLKVLEVMTEHNVALCLTPQAYHNVNVGADIFNNTNLSFWEYLLPGLDSWGYIACTGTNFAIRARALADCGWFPSWTITEDYALGMKLKERGYNGVYLKEYLAEGEAPQEIRNIFRQRSRWAKGQFQVLFSRCCPLFSPQLSMGMRLLYTSVTFSYVTNFVAVLTALLVPFVALVFGYYPLVINQRFAIACTVYLAACTLVNMFCYQLAHLQALWFASCSCVLLWFTWSKAMLSVPLSLMRIKRKAAFKATDKGGNVRYKKLGCGAYLKPPNVGNLEGTKDPFVLLLVLVISLATAGIGVYNLIVQPYTEQDNFRWYLLISVLWATYFAITPALFIFYCYNKGKIFDDICTLGMYACTLITAFSLYSVWQVPDDYSFRSVLSLALQFFNAQRSGPLPLQNDVPWRDDSAVFDSVMLKGTNHSLSGGWYDGGGGMKYTYSIASSVSMMAWGYIHFGEAFDKPVKGRALEVLKWGADYLMKCHIQPDGNKTEHQFVAQVGNLTQDRSTWIPAEAISKLRPVFLVNRTHPGSDLVGSAASALAAASVAFKDQARQYSESLLDDAQALYQFAVAHKGYYSKSVPTGGMYMSSSMYDDLALAACWLYRATHKTTFLEDCKNWRNKYLKEVANVWLLGTQAGQLCAGRCRPQLHGRLRHSLAPSRPTQRRLLSCFLPSSQGPSMWLG